jgi:hypothetical protein
MDGWMTLTLAWLPVLSPSAPTALADTPEAHQASEDDVALVQGWVQTLEEADALARRSLCREAREATRDAELDEQATTRLQAACPADFPVPAPPDFCLTGRCATL